MRSNSSAIPSFLKKKCGLVTSLALGFIFRWRCILYSFTKSFLLRVEGRCLKYSWGLRFACINLGSHRVGDSFRQGVE